MKFYSGLNEQSEEDIERVKETLKKRCMPFLEEFSGPVFRGYDKGISGLMSRKVARKDRKPRFVPQDIHEELDNLLEKKYGWRPRSNGIFTGDYNIANRFANKVYMFFPVGEYQYIGTEEYMDLYIRYGDLTSMKKLLDKGSLGPIMKIETENKYYEIKMDLKNMIRDNIYYNKYLNGIVKNNKEYEAIFNCESYYLVDTGLQDEWDGMQEI